MSDHPYDALREEDLRRRRSVKWRQYPADVLPVWVAEMDYPLADPVREVLLEMVERGDTGYVHPGGVAEAYAAFAAQRYGCEVDADGARVIPDVMSGVHHVLAVHTEPGATVVIDTPAYPPFFSTITAAERRVVDVPLVRDADGRFAHDLDALERAFAAGAAAYLFCGPHNPTGRVWSRAELETLAELADRYAVTVLADEVHAPLTYAGQCHIPFASLDSAAARRSVSFVSASKAWNLPGLKCALAVPGGAPAAELLRALPEELALGAGILGAAANIAAFRDGGPWLRDTLDYLAGNRRAVIERLPALLAQAHWSPPEATYLAWLDLRALGWGDDPASVLLEQGRVALYAGPEFGVPGRGFARLNLATSRALLGDALERMAGAVDGQRPRPGGG